MIKTVTMMTKLMMVVMTSMEAVVIITNMIMATVTQ